MSKKLTTISPSYHSFVEDQVLTHHQLNELIDYFEDQDRLSRICLSGVGLVCGFEVSRAANSSITITSGAGVSTDGDLFHLLTQDEEGNYQLGSPSITYTHFGIFDDSKAKYTPQFWKPGDQQLNIWEIFPAGQTDGKTVLTSFNAPGGLDAMVVVLYMESYTNDPGACTTISCDNQGAEEVRNVRVLLIHEDDMAYLNSPDTLFNAGDVLSTYLATSDADVSRITLDSSNSSSLDILKGDYFGAVENTDTVANMTSGIDLMLGKLNLTTLSGQIQSALTEAFKPGVLKGLLFQYRYDLLKDAADTYNELKELFLEKYGVCCPDINAFPKHLLLGYTTGSQLEPEENPYRHSFYKSPILDPHYDERDRFQALAERLLSQLTSYLGLSVPTEIQFTPSNLYVQLGKRAIPFYYHDGNTLLRRWDYDRSKYGRYERILGYHRSNNSSLPPVKKPFEFSIDPYNFIRIEGIQGLDYKTALDKVLELKDTYSLPFDVKVLGITVDDTVEIDVTEYACEFQDLSVLMSAWTSEQECIIGEVSYLLSGFSTAVEGDNIRKDVVLQFKEYRTLATKSPSVSTSVQSSDAQNAIVMSREPTIAAKTTEVTAAAAETSNVSSNASSGTVSGVKTSGTKATSGSSVVIDNMAVAEDTLGKVVYDAIEAAPFTDSSVIIAYIDQTLSQLSFDLWTPVVIDSTVKLPGKILAACYAIENLLPDSIEGLSDDTLKNYTSEIDKLCSYTKQLQAKYKEYVYGEYTVAQKGTTIIDQKILGMMDLLSNQLTNICCGAKKIQALLQEVEDRKKAILDGLRFSVFAEQHPGLEHKAGVEPGGTFVMVYSMGKDPSGLVKKGTVVADFALPYLCCSDCTPINFIVPKTPVSLTLSSDYFCLSGEPGSLDFNVSPADGVIAPEQAVGGLTINGTVLTIDPVLFPVDQIGVPIKFTVNNQYTDCTLIVRKKPTIDIKITSIAEPPFTYKFEPIGDVENSIFHWDFGDGSPVDTNAIPTHTYSIPLANGESSVTVSLTVIPNGGTCPATVSTPLLFDEVTVSITPTEVCENAEPVPFVITPFGANPVITGTGVTADMKFFDPGLTAGQTGPFDLTYNGNVFASMTILTVGSAEFTMDIGESSFFLNAVETGLSTYVWQFESGGTIVYEVENGPGVEVPYSKFTGLKKITARLKITSTCGDNFSEQTLDVPQEGTLSIPDGTLFCSNDSEGHAILTDGFSFPPVIEGSGVVNGKFVPSTANIGDNIITADGEPKLTVVVHKAPTAEFTYVFGADFIVLSADFTDVKQFQWRIVDLSGNNIIEPITNDKEPKIGFGELKENTSFIVYLAQEGEVCPKVATSQQIDLPGKEQGSVTLTPQQFCDTDSFAYPFTVTGYTKAPQIEGPGVDKELLTFTPSLAGPGEFELKVTDENGVNTSIFVTVKEGPKGDFKASISNDILSAENFGIIGTSSFYWSLTDKDGNEMRLDNQPNFEIPVSSLEIRTDRKPDYVVVTLILLGDPCTTIVQQEVDTSGGGSVVVTNPSAPFPPGTPINGAKE